MSDRHAGWDSSIQSQGRESLAIPRIEAGAGFGRWIPDSQPE
ncbi:hypothetical protein ABZN20_05475 [Methylococcus sp. ANG]